VGEVEREAAVPPPDAQAEVPTSGEPLPSQGPTLTMMVDASDWPRTYVAPDGDAAEASVEWPNFTGPAIV
jgi:hypothetical protein